MSVACQPCSPESDPHLVFKVSCHDLQVDQQGLVYMVLAHFPSLVADCRTGEGGYEPMRIVSPKTKYNYVIWYYLWQAMTGRHEEIKYIHLYGGSCAYEQWYF